MITEFKNQLFDELSLSSDEKISKELIADFFSYAETKKEFFKDKGTFLSSYLNLMEQEHLERYLTDLAEHNLTGVIAVELLSKDFYDLTKHSDFESAVNDHIVIGDEENTADYFDGMFTDNPFQKYCLYEMHFGKNHSGLTRIGTLAFSDDDFSECSYTDARFWNESKADFAKFALNKRLNKNLTTKHKSKTMKL
jgi:hypothetical protein